MLICFIRKIDSKGNVEEPSKIVLKHNTSENQEGNINISIIEGTWERKKHCHGIEKHASWYLWLYLKILVTVNI